MKHYLVLTNDNRKEILSEKEIKRIQKVDAEFDGVSSVSVVCEIDPQKVADNRWSKIKPDFPCLFLTRSKYGSETYCNSYTITEQEGYLAIVDGNGEEWGALEDLQADEYFVIERF